MDKGNYRAADSIATAVLAELPDNTIFLRIRAYALARQGRFGESLTTSQRLVDVSKARKPVNWSDVMTGYHSMIECLDAMGDSRQLLALADEATRMFVPRPYDKLPYVTESRNAICQLRKKYRK
jgi:hypothetical protein